MIPQNKIEEVQAASDIVEVVEEFGVRLKPSGSRYKGLCPFHEEKTPSFSVDPGKNLYYCFGCQRGGNLFTFVQEMEGASFVESVRLLAERVGITLPEEEGDREAQTEAESIYNALRFAARYYYEQLTQSEAGRPALRYLKDRGFTPETIKHFGLGYALDGWENLLTAAEEHHIAPDVLEKAGLVKRRKKGTGHYDVFRGRVLFPILSHIGKVLGFGGRILDDDADQPKYINSPETQVYNKRRVLYGLHRAKQAIRRAEEVLLVEGYTDVTALHQAGVENVVASSGTALTEGQVKLLGRYASRILLLYDADTAGATAALRGADVILEEGMAPYVVPLPGGDDPDSYVLEHGGDVFQAYVKEHNQDFISFRYVQAQQEGALDTPEGEASVMHAVMESVARIPDPLMQETYLRRASEVMKVPDIRLHEVLETIGEQQERKARRGRRREEKEKTVRDEDASSSVPAKAQENRAVSRQDAKPEPLPPEKLLHRLMLERGLPLVEFILGSMALDEFTEGTSRSMAAALLDMYENEKVDVQHFLGGSEGQAAQRLASEVMMNAHEASGGWQGHDINVPALNEDPYEAAASAMTLLKLRRVEEAIARQKDKMYRASKEDVDLQEMQREMMELHRFRKKIEARSFLDEDLA